MMKIIKYSVTFLFLSFILFVFLFNPTIIIDSVKYSLNVFINNVLPSLFPFFILGDILIKYNYIYFLNKVFKFKYSYIFLMSLFSGLPSNSKYIKELLDKNIISCKDASIILSTSFFPNPMFVIASVGFLIFGSIKLGITILLITYISNIIVYLFYYKKLTKVNIPINIKSESFFSFIKSSIINNVYTLIIILGTMTIFTIISNIIFNFIDLPILIENVLSAILEMTSGINKINEVNISLNIRFVLTSSIINFSSISIISQAFSILSDYNINKKLILKNKFLILLISFIISYFYSVFFIR